MFENAATQIREFNANTTAALGVIAISADPSYYQRSTEARDAVIRGRREQRKRVMARKTAYLHNNSCLV